MGINPRLSWNLRVTLGDKELIDRAVNASGLTRTDFVLQAARAAAQELLVERAWSAMAPEAYEAFRRHLDAPANPRMSGSGAPWPHRGPGRPVAP